MEKYISDAPFKTPRMQVYVYNSANENFKNLMYKYNAPPGLKLQEYVLSLHPNKKLEIYFAPNSKKLITEKWRNNFIIKVMDLNNCI